MWPTLQADNKLTAEADAVLLAARAAGLLVAEGAEQTAKQSADLSKGWFVNKGWQLPEAQLLVPGENASVAASYTH